MTHNQIEYANLKESKRHNIVGEVETNRHNVVTEYETARHNVETERIGWANLSETQRHNKAEEVETNRYHLANEAIDRSRLNETSRHNVATERIDSYRAIHEVAIGYQNAATNAYNARINEKNSRINAWNTKINEKTAISKMHWDAVNAETNRINALAHQKEVSVKDFSAHIEQLKAKVSKALADSTIDKNAAEVEIKRFEAKVKFAESLTKQKEQHHKTAIDWARLPAEYIRALTDVGKSAVDIVSVLSKKAS